MKNYIYFFLIGFLIVSCKQKETIEFGLLASKECKVQSPFILKSGFSAASAALSTSEKKLTGLALIDINNATKTYQHPTWIDKGNFGPIAIDNTGAVYVVPIPFVNVLDAVRKNQNVIYKVDPNTGEMKTLIALDQKQEKINTENAYGLVGMFFDCDTKLLYASSLFGSTKHNENGKIYCIDTKESPAKIIDTYNNVDAMGVGVANFNNKKTLFFGSTRTSAVSRIYLKDDGSFDGPAKYCFSLAGIGERGDDIVKKIRFTPQNQMQVTGIFFNYNLTAPTEKQESKYLFFYNIEKQIWQQ